MEQDMGGYTPVELVTAAISATGYLGPLSLKVFNASLNEPGLDIPQEHARRGHKGLTSLVQAVRRVPRFWQETPSFH